MPPYDQAKFKKIIDSNTSIGSNIIQTDNDQTHYHYIGEKSNTKPLVIFVHGSPGSSIGYAKFLNDEELVKQANIISIDRYGFGKSSRIPYSDKLTLQAKAIKNIITDYGNASKIILVGHSYGGPVIAKTSMDYASDIDGTLFLAPAVDPALEKTKWFQHIAKFPLIEWLIPRPLREANDEILPLKGQLEKIKQDWRKITAQSVVIQGTKDKLVPKGNAEFIANKLPNTEIIYIENEGHFLPWRHFDLIKTQILKLLKA